MKSYTDLKQSQELVTFLPMISADMYYPLPCTNDDIPVFGEGGFGSTPCWSLAALFKVIRNCNLGYLMQTTYDNNNVILTCEIGEKPYTIMTSEYDNEVNACVEMIVKLHKEKIL